jgi:hypothetical protein
MQLVLRFCKRANNLRPPKWPKPDTSTAVRVGKAATNAISAHNGNVVTCHSGHTTSQYYQEELDGLHVALMGENIVIHKRGRRLVGRPTSRWGNNIEVNIK